MRPANIEHGNGSGGQLQKNRRRENNYKDVSACDEHLYSSYTPRAEWTTLKMLIGGSSARRRCSAGVQPALIRSRPEALSTA